MGELARVKAQLKMGEAYLFNNEDGTLKSLRNPLSFMTGLLQDSYQEITGLL